MEEVAILKGSDCRAKGAAPGFKVAVLGASGGIGQPLSLLMKMNPLVSVLHLYDVVNTPGVTADISHMNTGAVGIAKCCPNVIVNVISNPVNSTVPIAAEVFKKAGTYDPKRLLGVTTLDVVRANTFVGEVLGLDPRDVNVPVVGGHAGVTILPLLSQVNPPCSFTSEEISYLTSRIQNGGTEVVEAYAAAKFADACLRGLRGDAGIVECSYIASQVTELPFFASKVRLGRSGVEEVLPLGPLNEFERAGLEKAKGELAESIHKGVAFANKLMCAAQMEPSPGPLFPAVHQLPYNQLLPWFLSSEGVYEALELRDGGSDYLGKGVSKAVNNVNSIIAPALVGKDPTAQTELDNFMVQKLDGTKNEWGWCKQKLGANAILAVSLAVCKAGASVKKIPLYQEFMILPTGAASFKEAMKMGVEVYHNLKSVIKKKYGQDATNVGDEGGFAPNIQENKEGLELLKTAIEKAGYTGKVVIGMDVAASEFYNDKDKTYDLNFKEENNDGSQKISGDSLKNVYKSFVSEYPIVSIEDPFDQDDWVHYAKMTEECGVEVQIVGDDLLVTNPTRVAKAIQEKSCNALLLKVNQIGSVTESIEAVKMSKHAGWGVMTSHRSGETEDTFIADLAVGLSTGQIKTGAPCRSERLAKYNQASSSPVYSCSAEAIF
ncbi:Enolase 2 [Triticum urartu]|uniref:Enolase 2 n=1 Tax=Triticum urartu TaxID=4572 RepID=M7ZLY3_TRIUA|nr:Enolase 2 [Triticum urartu]